MELVDRYLNTVKMFLPRSLKQDIVRELAENIRSEMDEKEAEVGHALTEAEQVAILRKHGNPFLAASRYAGERHRLAIGRELIGPELFPLYVRVLSLAVAFVLLITILVRYALDTPADFRPLILPVAIQFIVITTIFSVVQACHEKFHLLDRWTPASLWPREKPRRIPYSESIAEIVGGVLFLLWWGPIRHFANEIFGPAGWGVVLAPVWRTLGPAMVVLAMLGIIRASISLVQPDWIRFHLIGRLVTDLGGIGIMAMLIQSGSFIVPTSPAAIAALSQMAKMGERQFTVLQITNGCIALGFWIAAAVIAIDAFVAIRRGLRA